MLLTRDARILSAAAARYALAFHVAPPQYFDVAFSAAVLPAHVCHARCPRWRDARDARARRARHVFFSPSAAYVHFSMPPYRSFDFLLPNAMMPLQRAMMALFFFLRRAPCHAHAKIRDHDVSRYGASAAARDKRAHP